MMAIVVHGFIFRATTQRKVKRDNDWVRRGFNQLASDVVRNDDEDASHAA
jgi:hypothetical protein